MSNGTPAPSVPGHPNSTARRPSSISSAAASIAARPNSSGVKSSNPASIPSAFSPPRARFAPAPPPVWIQSATAHIYGDTADELLDESSPIGQGFAPTVGLAWEKAFTEVDLPACRKVILRTTFVLGRHGGPLPILARLSRWFLGGRTGSGKQYMSWIHEADLQAILLRALKNPDMHGIYVVTAPLPLTNQQFMQTLRSAVGRPWSPPVPALIVRLGAFFLRTDPELALLGRRCVPTRLLREGFEFRFAELRSALEDLVG